MARAYLKISETDLTLSGLAAKPAASPSGAKSKAKGKKDNPLADMAKHADGKPLPPTVEFTFNPKELQVQSSANFAARHQPGASANGAKTEFLGPSPRQMSFTAFFDSTGEPGASVSEPVEALIRCCNPTKASIDKDQPTPPTVTLMWGSMTGFPCHLESVQVQMKLFDENGAPLRATAAITLKEIPTSAANQNPTSGGTELLRSRRVVSGDSLPSLAYELARRADRWRVIAEANGIDDPLRLRPGTWLRLPVPAELKGTRTAGAG